MELPQISACAFRCCADMLLMGLDFFVSKLFISFFISVKVIR